MNDMIKIEENMWELFFKTDSRSGIQLIKIAFSSQGRVKKIKYFDFSEFEEACALAQADRISTFATQDCINEYMPPQGLYPSHLCCQTYSTVSIIIRVTQKIKDKKFH